MKKIFTFCLLILNIHNLFGQNCNLQFGYTRTGSTQHFTNTFDYACKGDNITINADLISGASYQWFVDEKEIKGATQNIYETKDIAGKYVVKATIGNCVYSRSFTLYIVENINPVFGSFNYQNDNILCNQNEGKDLWVFPSVTGNIKYQWQKDGVDIEGAKEASYFASPNSIYSVRVSQGSCSSSTQPLKMTSSNQISASISINGQSYFKDTLKVCKGVPIALSMDYSSFTDFKLFKDNKPTNLQNQGLITESGVYHMEAKTGNCLIKTKALTVMFGETMSNFTIEQTSDNIRRLYSPCYINQLNIPTSTIISMMRDSDVFTYEWKRNGITQSKGSYFFLIDKVGVYSVVARKGACQQESEKLEVKSISPQVSEFSYGTKGKRVELCAGSGRTYLIPYSINGFQGGLYKDGKLIFSKPFLSSYSSYGEIVNITEPGKYYTIFTDNTCTQYSDTVEVIIKGRKIAPIFLDYSQCQNGVFNLSVPQEAGLSYAWKKDGKVIPNLNTSKITVKETGSYLAVINQDYCSVESSEVVIGAKIKTSSPFCEGDTLKLSSSLADSYQWTGPNNFTSNSQNPSIPNISTKNNGVYILSTQKGACTFTDSLVVKVNRRPSIALDRADNYCLGKNISMIASTKSNNAYMTWKTPVSYYDGNYLSINNSTKSDNGLYSVTITEYLSRCTNTITTQITLSESNCNSIELENPTKPICANGQNTLEYKLNGNFSNDEIFNLYYIDYYGIKTKIVSSTKSPFIFNNRYYNRLFIESSKLKIRSSIINVNTENSFVYISTNYTKACDGFSVPIKIDSNRYKFEKIQWLLNGKEIPNATKYTHNADKTGIYTVRAEKNGCIATYDGGEQKVNITIGEINPAYISTTNSSSVCDGFTVGLKADTLYLKDTKYQWQLDGIDIPNATNSKFLTSETGNYTLKTIQGKCEAISDKRKIYVGELKSPNIYSSPFELNNNVVEICNGMENSLQTSDYVIFTSRKDSSGYEAKYQWQKNGVDIPNATKEIFTSKEVGVYRLKVIQGNCVSFSKNITVKIGNPRLMSLYSLNLPKACEGDSLYIYNSERNIFNGIAKRFTLFKNDKVFKELSASQQSIYLKESGKYFTTATFTVPDSKETCTIFSDTLNVEIKNKTVSYKIPDYYSSSCSDSLQVYSQYYFQNATHQWKFNGSVLPKDTTNTLTVKKAGTYQVETKNENGCIYYSEPFVIEFGKLNVEFFEQNNTFCLKNENYLYPNIKGNYDYNLLNYEWLLDGVKTGKNNSQQITKSGTYTLKVNQGTCTSTASAKIEVIEIPKSINKDSLFICPNGSVVIEAPKVDKYTWLLNNQPFTNNETQNIKASSMGKYSVWMEKGECSGMSNIINVVQSNTPPTATISGSKDLNIGDSTRVKIDLTSLPPWTIKLTNNQSFTAEKTPYEFVVKPNQTTIYELASVENACGKGTVSGKAEVKIIILGDEEIAGAKINIFPIPAETTCQLTVETVLPEKLELQLFSNDGKLLSKIEKNTAEYAHHQNLDLNVLPSGTYFLKIKVGEKIVFRKIIKQN